MPWETYPLVTMNHSANQLLSSWIYIWTSPGCITSSKDRSGAITRAIALTVSTYRQNLEHMLQSYTSQMNAYHFHRSHLLATNLLLICVMCLAWLYFDESLNKHWPEINSQSKDTEHDFFLDILTPQEGLTILKVSWMWLYFSLSDRRFHPSPFWVLLC